MYGIVLLAETRMLSQKANNKKVLLLTFVPLELKGAGTARLAYQLADFLSKKPGIKLEVCTFSQNEERIRTSSWSYITFKGISLKFLGDISPKMIQYILKKRKQYDVILIIGTNTTFSIVALLLKLLKRQIKIIQIPQLHKDFIFRDPIARFLFELKKWLFIYFVNFRIAQPIVIAFSDQEKDLIKPFVRNVVKQPLGIDIKRYEEVASLIDNMKKHIDARKDKLILLHVGDIHRNKFPMFALEVMKALKETLGDKVMLIAVGRIHEGHYKKLREKIRQYDLEKNICFTGLVSEDRMVEYWSKADIFVLFSASEAGPFTVLEALALGIPVVATRVGIVPELERKGMLLAVNFNDINNMVRKILMLWQNENLRRSLIEKAKKEITKYDINYLFETIYQLIIS
jgi:glycosyltransferase involved in cell wall biosynthesis